MFAHDARREVAVQKALTDSETGISATRQDRLTRHICSGRRGTMPVQSIFRRREHIECDVTGLERKVIRRTPGVAQEKGGPLRPASFGCQQGGSWRSQSNYWLTATFSAESGNSLGAFFAAFEEACDGGVGRPAPVPDFLVAFEAPLPGSLSAASISSSVFT